MCKYCEELDIDGCGSDIALEGTDWTDCFNLWRNSVTGEYSIECYADHSSPIKFCPMCGRNLRED